MGRGESSARRRRRTPWVVVGLVVVTAAAVLLAVRGTGDPAACEQTTDVRVTAAPEIANVVRQVGQRITGADACSRFEVTARDPGAIENSLSSDYGSDRPDVWIPDSSLRLRRAVTAGAGHLPSSGTSIANSPVVFAVTEQAAGLLGWPNRPPRWSDILSDTRITLGMPDPARDPVGVSALLGVRQATASGSEVTAADGTNSTASSAAYAAALRRLSPNTLPAVDDLYARLAGAPDEKRPLDAFPASENSLLAYNASHSAAGPQGSLVAVYPPQPLPSLDYPFTVLAAPGTPEREAAEKLLAALLAQPGQQALADAGFRAPDGHALRNRSSEEHASAVTQTVAEMPPDDVLDPLLNQWARVNQSSRATVLIDVSGSMNDVVPSSGGKTRLQLTLDAAVRGLRLFKPTSQLAIWTFSTNLDGAKDYREIVPMSQVSEELTNGAVDKIRAIRAVPNGGTGLYDSVLAAYQRARDEWEPGKLNLVIVLTDGHNDDRHGISRTDLLKRLSALADPSRPVSIIGIGIGPEVDEAELSAITKVAGGKTFVTTDPARISDVFYSSLAALSG